MLKRLREWRFRYTWLIGIAIALLTFGVWRSWIGLTGPPTACLTFQPSPLEPALAEAKRDHAALFDARFGPGAEWEVRHRLAQSENRALLALSDLEDAVAADNAARAAAARRVEVLMGVSAALSGLFVGLGGAWLFTRRGSPAEPQ